MIETPNISDPSMIYMYGISDFWAEIFGDTRLVESILESETISLGEVYSYFLQRAAGISLADIQSRYNTRIRLLLIGDADKVDDAGTTFRIDSSITSTSKIANRPILPTQTLDNAVHYEIMNNEIRFYQPLEDLKFPVRYNANGDALYALWMTDVEIDEKWIDNSFGRLVGFTEDDAIFNYKSFIEGVYYLYSNGPNIEYIERGVNLAMGMPYARATEEVLGINKDAITGNWVVFTNTQAYVIPYGYRPELKIGDTVTENVVIDTWVSVIDHVSGGDWWYNVYLPQEVLGPNTISSDLGRCQPGTTGDNMMQTFLKHHMFEVLVTQPNGDISSFNTVQQLVLRSKPEYTYPIFVWKVPVEDEVIDIVDDFTYYLRVDMNESMLSSPSIRFMDRSTDNPDDADYNPVITRGRHLYNRFQGSTYAATFLGYGDWAGNGGWSPEFEDIDENYLSYLDRLMHTRGDIVSPHNRGNVTRGWRGHIRNTDDGGNPLPDTLEGYTWSVPGTEVYPSQADAYEVNDRNMTPLYMLTGAELLEKMLTVDYKFKLNDGINRYLLTGLDLNAVYDTWFRRNLDALTAVEEGARYDFGFTSGGLDISFSEFANQAYLPSREDLFDEDGNPLTDGVLFISRNTKDVWTVQWVRNDISNAPTLFPLEDLDYLRAIEHYEYSTLGQSFPHRDKYIASGQTGILAPVIYGLDATYIVTIGDYCLPSAYYTVSEDNANIVLDTPPAVPGNATWLPWVAPDEYLNASGDTYNITREVTRVEDLILAYSPTVENYTFITDFTIAPNLIDGGTTITLGTALPPGGDLVVMHTNSNGAPTQDSFTPAGLTYTIPAGYTVKIFVGNRLLSDTEYYTSDTTLGFNVEPTENFIVRYYDTLSYTMDALFNRSTVQRNKARFLMDRSRENGEYDPQYDEVNAPTVYMNRSGRAWAEVPELGEPPVYADDAYVTRRLR